MAKLLLSLNAIILKISNVMANTIAAPGISECVMFRSTRMPLHFQNAYS